MLSEAGEGLESRNHPIRAAPSSVTYQAAPPSSAAARATNSWRRSTTSVLADDATAVEDWPLLEVVYALAADLANDHRRAGNNPSGSGRPASEERSRPNHLDRHPLTGDPPYPKMPSSKGAEGVRMQAWLRVR